MQLWQFGSYVCPALTLCLSLRGDHLTLLSLFLLCKRGWWCCPVLVRRPSDQEGKGQIEPSFYGSQESLDTNCMKACSFWRRFKEILLWFDSMSESFELVFWPINKPLSHYCCCLSLQSLHSSGASVAIVCFVSLVLFFFTRDRFLSCQKTWNSLPTTRKLFVFTRGIQQPCNLHCTFPWGKCSFQSHCSRRAASVGCECSSSLPFCSLSSQRKQCHRGWCRRSL